MWRSRSRYGTGIIMLTLALAALLAIPPITVEPAYEALSIEHLFPVPSGDSGGIVLTGFGDTVASLANRAAGLNPDERQPGDPSILGVARTNSVILTGTASHIAEIKDLIVARDAK